MSGFWGDTATDVLLDLLEGVGDIAPDHVELFVSTIHAELNDRNVVFTPRLKIVTDK